jgi:hypothetical protein
MKKVYKHVVKVVFLSECEDFNEAIDHGNWDLEDIDRAIGFGDCLGSYGHESTEEIVGKEAIAKECIELGNDGTFFESFADGEEECV